MRGLVAESPAGHLSGRQQLLRPVPSFLFMPFSAAGTTVRRILQANRRQLARVSEAPSEPIASTSEAADIDKELVAEKAREGMHRFSASTRKVGASRLVVDSLKRVSLTFLGDDHELNYGVAKLIGSRLGWFAVDMTKVMCGMRKVGSLAELSRDEQAATEAEVLRGLRNQFRVITTPLPSGSVTRENTWNDLWGTVVVWIDEEDKLRPKPRTPERALYEGKAEVTVRVKALKGFAVKGGASLANRAKVVAEALLPRLGDFLAEYSDLPDRKRQYVELGCRGDWPQLQPADWSPVVQSLAAERRLLGGFLEGAERVGEGQTVAEGA